MSQCSLYLLLGFICGALFVLFVVAVAFSIARRWTSPATVSYLQEETIKEVGHDLEILE